MRNETRVALTAYVSAIALMNSIPVEVAAATKFTVTPSLQQKLVDKVQLSSEFLSKINMPLVVEMQGELIGLGVSGTIASRTNTATTDRAGRDPSTLDNRTYLCKQTNFDTYLTYGKLDLWAKFSDFRTRISAQIAKRIALDLIMIGWNGTSAAVATDPATYTMLQDVNIGWLQKLRTEAPAQVLSDGADTDTGFTAKVTYGSDPDADYVSLDALVYDAKMTLLPEWAREDTELVVIVGSALLHDKYFPLINKDDDAENQLARDVIMSTKRLGGLPAVIVPHFPANTIVITRFDNLSIYEQEGKHRRQLIDNPKRDRYDNFESGNYAYVIEDLDYICMVENIANNEA